MAEVITSLNSGTAITSGGEDRAERYPMSGDLFQKIATLVTDRWEFGYNHYRARFEQFYRYERLIEMISKKKQFDWKANAYLPYPFAMSELSASMKWLAIFGTRPYVTVKSRMGSALAEVADRRQTLIDWHMGPGSDIDLFDTTQRMFRMSERYGKAIALCVPEWNEKEMRYRSLEDLPTAMSPMSRMVWKTRQTQDYRIRLIPLDLTDVVVQPGRRRINGPEGCHWIIRRYYKTREELESLEAAGLIGPAVGGQTVSEITFHNEPDQNEFRLRRMFLKMQDDHERFEDKHVQRIEILEAQQIVPDELVDPAKATLEEQFGRDPKKRVQLVANGKTVLGDYALPWDHGMWSYVEMDCVAEVYDFYGKGKVQPIEHMTYVANEIMNMRLDNVKMAINGLVGVHGNRMPPGWKRRLVSQPFGILETLGPPNEVIQRIQLGDVTQSSYQEQAALYGLMQDATAVNETMMGNMTGAVRTLGEQRLKAELSSTRIQFELVGQAHQLLGYPYGLAGFILAYDRQYLPFGTYISVVSPEYPDDFLEVPVDHRMFETEDYHFQYTVTGASEGMNLASKRTDMANMLAIMNPWMPILGQFYGPEFINEMVKMVLKTFGYDPSRFIPRGLTPGVLGTPELEGGGGMGMGGNPEMAGGGSPPSPTMPTPGGPGRTNASMVSSALGMQ